MLNAHVHHLYYVLLQLQEAIYARARVCVRRKDRDALLSVLSRGVSMPLPRAATRLGVEDALVAGSIQFTRFFHAPLVVSLSASSDI